MIVTVRIVILVCLRTRLYFSEYTEMHYCNDCYYDEHFYCEYADADYHVISLIQSMYLTANRNGYCEERVSDWAVECCDYFMYCDNDDEYWHTDLAYYCEHEDIYISQRAIDAGTYFISDWDGEVYPDDLMAVTDTGDTVSIDEAKDDDREYDEENNIWKKERGGRLMHSLVEMLRYKRPEGSATQRAFCKRFLEPTFGKPDQFGNYIKIIGDEPNLCFTAHHDTVHKDDGFRS